MDKSPSLINRYPVLLGISLFILSTVFCWLMFLKYGSANIFYVLNVMYLLCIVLFIIGAMKYKDVNLITGILLSVASLLFIMALFDFYLITFCYETSGPGGEHVISHRNWHNKFVWKNEQGFWERSLAAFEKTDRRNKGLVIAVVGDSFTWGQGIKGNKHRFTEQLEEKLNASSSEGKRIAVLNFGRGGADTRQEIQIVREAVAKIHPDIVIICYLSNDIDSGSFAGHWEKYGDTGEKLSSITPTVNYFYWRFIGLLKYHHIGRKYMESLVEAYNNPKTFQKHQDELRTLITEIKAMGAQPIFVILPFPQMWKLFPKSTRDDIYNHIAASLRQEQVPVIDLSYMEEKYPLEKFQVNSADAHPNEKMHAEFAGALYQWLVNNQGYKDLLDERN